MEKGKHSIDPIKFNREYLARFEGSGNSIFYCFDRRIHVTKEVSDLLEHEDVHIGIDFNISLQCSSVFAKRGNQMHYLDEFKGHPDTETLAIAIKTRYPNRRIFAYPDPTGNARKTSAAVGVTDFTILARHGLKIRAHKKSPPIIDSVACVNRMLKTAAGDISMYIHPRCTGIIESLERSKWVENNPDSATIDKTENVEHFSDGVRYATEYLFPIKPRNVSVKRGFGF